MSVLFTPPESLAIFCRFCGKVNGFQLDRSIAGNGRTIDKNSTFEFYCTKCFKTACFSGGDLIGQFKPATPAEQPREYAPQSHYCLGERIYHKKFKDTGQVVNRYAGTPGRILVQFQKSGLKKLVHDM
jgi:hypothetical protein